MNEMSKTKCGYPNSPLEALVLALKLAITAPSEDKAQKCVDIAEQIADGLTEFEVEVAKREAVEQARTFGLA